MTRARIYLFAAVLCAWMAGYCFGRVDGRRDERSSAWAAGFAAGVDAFKCETPAGTRTVCDNAPCVGDRFVWVK